MNYMIILYFLYSQKSIGAAVFKRNFLTVKAMSEKHAGKLLDNRNRFFHFSVL